MLLRQLQNANVDYIPYFSVSMLIVTACAVTGSFANYWTLKMGDCEYSINVYLSKVTERLNALVHFFVGIDQLNVLFFNYIGFVLSRNSRRQMYSLEYTTE